MNKNLSLRIVASVHYNVRDLIVKVVPQTGFSESMKHIILRKTVFGKDIGPITTTFID